MATSRRLGIAGGAILLLLSMSIPALAAYRRPRDARPPSTATSTSGGRTGGAVSYRGLQLTPLAPQQYVGQSISAHPTFTWFVPGEQSMAGEFQLYELTAAGTFRRVLDEPHEFISEQGFMSFTLPQTAVGLQPNTQYIWQVLLRYGDRPSDIVKVRSQIEIVDAARFSVSLAEDAATRVEQFAEAGLWYDAIALVSALPVAEANQRRDALLLDLANVESSMETSMETPMETPSETIALSSTDDVDMSTEESAHEETPHSQTLRLIVNWESSQLFP